METEAVKAPLPADIVATARGWIGTPYIDQASLKGVGCDCLGILRGVWREVLGTDTPPIPIYSADWAEATGEELMLQHMGQHLDTVPRADMREGDVLVFRMLRGRPAKHCGILALNGEGGRTVIHSRQNKRVSEEPLTEEMWRRIAAVFRLKGMAA
jgi:NlpC/P60 family putative phage cell wall peptidase